MSESLPTQELIDEAIDRTGFKRSVIELLYDEYVDLSFDGEFFDFLGDLLGNASFVIAAAKGFSVNGCLAAYDYGYQTVTEEGITFDSLSDVIDEIELEGLPNTEDDSEEG